MLTSGIGNKLHTGVLNADNALSKSIERVASGKRINRASDDAAASAQLAQMEAQTRGITQMMANQQDQASVLQTATASLSTTANMLQGINHLSVQASNGTLTDADRRTIQNQISQLVSQINMGASQTQYNGKNLLDGSFSTVLPSGENFAIGDMSATGLGLGNLSVATMGDAANAISTVQSAIGKVSSVQGALGSAINGIGSSVSNLQQQFVNATSAQSQIGDVDMAEAIMNMTMNSVQQQASMSVFKMGLNTRSNAVSLLSEM